MQLSDSITLPSGLVVENRVALAPMTNKQSHADGLLGDAELAFLARRADGGFGMIATCAAYVALDGKAWEGELAVDRDACLPGLTRLAARIKQGGAAAIVQLFHGGVRADSTLTGEPVWSASAFSEPNLTVPRAGTVADIERTIAAFVDAAARCQAAGWDGVELHGAHGYLLCQFLSKTQNTRDDEWGGASLENRARLLRTVVRQTRARCGKAFTLGVRLSLEDFAQAKGLDLDESLQVARWLAEDGVDFIHASLWDVARNSQKRPDVHPLTALREAVPRTSLAPGSNTTTTLAPGSNTATGLAPGSTPNVALIAAGKIWSRADAEGVLAKGADMVALGRSGIINPDWPRVVAEGRDPQRSPVPRADLLARAVSPGFVDYLSIWKNFLAD